MESKEYEDLFDIYLEDTPDGESIPEEFIVSSKIIFISNSNTIPEKVKPHTLSFLLEKSKEDSLKDIESKTNEIIENNTETTIESDIQKSALADLKLTKKSKGTFQDYLKLLIIRSAKMSETTALSWIVAQG